MTAPVNEGDILAGKYRVEKVLGVGGMGVVVAAHHIHLDEKVAIKFLLPDMLGNQEAVSRFLREAKAAVRIKSEHVARVKDVGTLDTGAPYMVMEYLEGGDLSSWIERRGKLPVEQAVEFVLQAGEAIAEAHGMGIVHRDLKPANLFVTRRADSSLSVKVLDFGISKVSALGGSGPDMGMTKTTAILGSPFYMSPEQLESAKSVDARSDVWALGIILYELITGGTPFVAETLPELVLKIVRTEPAPLSVTRSDAPPGLQAVVTRCLEKDRARRFQSVADLALALRPFGSARARESIERIVRVSENANRSARGLAPMETFDPDGAAKAASPGTLASWGTTHSKGGMGAGSRAAILVATLVGMGSLAAGTYLVFGRETAAAPSAEPSTSLPEPASATAPLDVASAVSPAVSAEALAAAAASATPVPSATTSAESTPSSLRERPAPRPPGRPKLPVARPVGPAPAAPPPPVVTPAAPATPKPSVFDDRK